MTAAPPNRDDFLRSTDWLADQLARPSVKLQLLDCRFYFDDADRGRRAYEQAHIPGAQYLNWTKDISEPRGHLLLMAPSAGHLEQAMRRLGIDDDALIVGYDDEGGHYVSRLWVILRRFGHHNVRILEGGVVKWLAEGRATESGTSLAPDPGTFTVTAEDPSVLLSAEEVLATRDEPNTILLDVRRFTEFTGEEVRAKHGGRIPWAQWLLWQDNLNWSGERDFKPIEEIRQRYEDAGVTPDKRIVTYCHGGVRAAHTALTLNLLGYPNVQVYDGSWEDWGSRDDLPIAMGEPEQ